MGPIVDRSQEYMLMGDAAIVKMRRLLLEAIENEAMGRTPTGYDPKSYRVRSLRCELPKGADMAAAMGDLVKIDRLAAQ